MSHGDAATKSAAGSTAGRDRSSGSQSGFVSKAQRYVERGTRTGGFAAATGAMTLLRAARSLWGGKRVRGVVRLLLGAAWIGVAFLQRRNAPGRSGGGGAARSDVDQTDVVHTAPDIEDVAGTGPSRDRSGDAADAVDTVGVNVEEAEPAPEVDSDVDAEGVDQTDVVDTGVDSEDLEEAEEGESTEES